MQLIQRVRDITVATFNEQMEKAEDPVKAIDRFLADTRQEIDRAEALHAQCNRHSLQMKRQWLEAERRQDSRARQAELALQEGREAGARAALSDKLTQEEIAAQYKALYEESAEQLTQLRERLQELHGTYQAAADRRQYYAARMETLRLQQSMPRRGTAAGADPARMFHRLEEQLGDRELETRALRELRSAQCAPHAPLSPEREAAAEQALQQLKQKLAKGSR
ncbi:PspA/IM30 family protein [Paenibacillus sp. IB182496]|uniref:PspA/IM30 family protein n=1 Tax=Paenibacillus sabuli TaxID=2772509 RepID=A0A927GTY5_9BACL|nr:PspA/IM30 family protein [Paenibacillus sabuli]MBD2847172.1 PspA/IM30 family protein [Paenibacillus sabuli]